MSNSLRYADGVARENQKQKRKMEERIAGDSSLSLSLSIGGGRGGGSSFQSLMSHEEQRQYACKFCTKTFSNPQALGGHQNAHRRERLLAKVQNEFGLGPHSFPYSSQHPFTTARLTQFYHGIGWPHLVAPAAADYGYPYGMINAWNAQTPLSNNNNSMGYATYGLHNQLQVPSFGANLNRYRQI